MARNGFTLIEVLVSLAIIAIALLAIMKAFSSQVRMTAQLRDHCAALYVAETILSRAQLGLLERGQTQGALRSLRENYEWQLLKMPDNHMQVVVSHGHTRLLSLET